MYNNLLKRIIFPSLSIYFFPIFSHFCPSPNTNFGVSWAKMRLDPPPPELNNKSKDYPLCPEIKNISENMLSNYQKYLNDRLNIKYSEADKKLILDLLPKKF